MQLISVICPLCKGKNNTYVFDSVILGKYEVDFYLCGKCGLLFLNQPYWLDGAYEDSINIYDTGVLARNITFSKITACLIYLFFNKSGKFLDYAGGYGIFTRLMRDVGFDFYLYDFYSKNLMARGFEKNDDTSSFELLTCFEGFEHFLEPENEFEEMFSLSRNIVFSTELLPSPIPAPGDWWYYGLEHGQHIAFYSRQTLEYIANKYGVNFYAFGPLYIFTPKVLSQTLLKLVMKGTKYGLSRFVCSRMRSKTFEDMEHIKSVVQRKKGGL